MASYIPDQGDIVWIDFNPSAGKEIMKRRPAYVISKKALNSHTGMAIVAPVTSTLRGVQLEVVISSFTKTQGAILVHQLKSLDYKKRQIKFIERCPFEIIQKVKAIATVLVD